MLPKTWLLEMWKTYLPTKKQPPLKQVRLKNKLKVLKDLFIKVMPTKLKAQVYSIYYLRVCVCVCVRVCVCIYIYIYMYIYIYVCVCVCVCDNIPISESMSCS